MQGVWIDSQVLMLDKIAAMKNSMAYENSRLCDKVYTFFLKSRNYDALLYDFFRAPLFNEQEHIRTGG